MFKLFARQSFLILHTYLTLIASYKSTDNALHNLNISQKKAFCHILDRQTGLGRLLPSLVSSCISLKAAQIHRGVSTAAIHLGQTAGAIVSTAAATSLHHRQTAAIPLL